jgi:hypothetical protein
MDRVQLGQEVRGILGKIFRGQVLKEICSLKPPEQLIGLALDMLRKAERIASSTASYMREALSLCGTTG